MDLTDLIPQKRLIEFGAFLLTVTLALVGLLAFSSHEQGIGYQRRVAEEQAVELKATKLAAQKTQTFQKRVDDAEAKRDRNRMLAQQNSDAARDVLDSLRRTVSSLPRGVPQSAGQTGTDATAAVAGLLADCAAEYRKMGQAAQGHYLDAAAFDKAFPQQPKEVKRDSGEQ